MSIPPIVAAFNPRSGRREPVEFALAVSRRLGAPLIVVAVLQEPGLAAVMGRDGGREARALDELHVELRRSGPVADVKVVEAVTAGAGLIRELTEVRPLFVALGTTERGGLSAAILGTTVERVIHAHVCPVAVVPHGYAGLASPRAIVGAGFCPTPEGRDALETAAALAGASGARLQAISVLAPSRPRPAGERALRDAVEGLGEDVDVALDVRYDDPAAGLLAASRRLDLLVLGSRGHSPRRALALGSVSRRVAERASCPVLVLPRGAADESGALLAHAAAHPAA